MTNNADDSAGDSVDGDRTRIGVMAPVVKPARPAAETATPSAGDTLARDTSAGDADAGDKTQVLSMPPPTARPATVPAAMQAAPHAQPDRDGADHTQILVGAPPAITVSSAARGVAPSPSPSSSVVAPSAPPQPLTPLAPTAAAPAATTVASVEPATSSAGAVTAQRTSKSSDIDDDRTVVMRRVESKLKLVRVPPSGGNSEPIVLGKPRLVIGRGRHVDIKLYSPTSSREHACLQENGGKWTIESIDGRSVYVDDTLVETEIELQPGMKIRLGDDELLVALANAGRTESQGSPGLLEKLLSWWKELRGRAQG